MMSGIMDSAVQISTGTTDSLSNPSKKLVQDALVANKRLQQILTLRAEQLEAELKEADDLLETANADEGDEDPEPEIIIPGAKKAAGLFSSSELLNQASPFYEEAKKRSTYIANTTPRPMKAKDLENLATAVRQENERLRAYKRSQSQHSNPGLDTHIDLDSNIEGLDWTRIAERVSDSSSVKRTATECRVVWIGDRHPRINHAEWSASEVRKLNSIVSGPLKEKKPIDWVQVAGTLGTNRTPLDCMRRGFPQHRHNWTSDADQKLIKAVESCGIDNWQLVARNVSEYVSAGQCQGRWQKTINPALRRGPWTAEEDELLRKAIDGYGNSWVQVATAIPGRTNDQCRERWNEHVKLSSVNIDWSEAEDKNLLELVGNLGNQWKAISCKIGNNKTGPNCRMRYDKLKRLQKKPINSSETPGGAATGTSNIAGPSQFVQMQNPEEGMSVLTFAIDRQETCTQRPGTALPIPASTVQPRPKPRAVRKGNDKGSTPMGIAPTQISASELLDVSQNSLTESGTLDATQCLPTASRRRTTEKTSQPDLTDGPDIPEPQRKPKPRPKGFTKTAALAGACTADDNVTKGGVSQSDLMHAPEVSAQKPKPKPRPKKVQKVAALPETPTIDASVGPVPTENISTPAAQASTRGRKRKAVEPAQGEPNQEESSVVDVPPDCPSDPAIPFPERASASTSKRGRKRKAMDNAEGEMSQDKLKTASLPAETGSTPSVPPTDHPLTSAATKGRKRKTTESAECEINLSASKKTRTTKATGGRSKNNTSSKMPEHIAPVAPTTSEVIAPTPNRTTEAPTNSNAGLAVNLLPESSKEEPQLRRGRSRNVLSPTTKKAGPGGSAVLQQ